MTNSVSVVIPTYNRRGVIMRAIASVQAQTCPVSELIVVDDGSDDGTAQALAELDGVRYIYQNNQGVSAARNRGIDACSSRFVAFLDSDDAWLPTKLESQLEELGKTGLQFCHTEEIWIRNGVRVNQKRKHRKAGGDQFERSIELCCISPSSVLIARELFDIYGVFDTALPACEDYDLWLRICAFQQIAFVDTPQIYKYGGHDDQLSRAFPAMDRFRLKALEKLLLANAISENQRRLVLQNMKTRLRVLWMGAQKRENLSLMTELSALKERWALDHVE